MSRARILVVSERCWPDGGGGELATHLVIDMLRKEFDIIVLTGSKNPSKLFNVEYIYEPLLSRWEKPALWLNITKLIKTDSFLRMLRESDVVYVPRFAFPIIPYAKKIGKKVIVHLHDYILLSYTATILAPYEMHKHRIVQDDIMLECMKGMRHCIGVDLLWWLPRLARRWVSQADKVICVSKRHAEIVSDFVPELRDKIEVVYNPVPSEILSYELKKELDDTPTFLYVGGDSYVKGFHILLHALKELGRQGIKAKFIFTNNYNSRNLETLKHLNDKYKNLRIQVMGRVKYEELLEIHKKAWALIFPSIWEETFGYAIVEAMLLGTIPIASRVGGIPELVRGTPVELMLFTPHNPIELSKSIKSLTEFSPKYVNALGMKIKISLLQRLDQNSVYRKLIQIFGD